MKFTDVSTLEPEPVSGAEHGASTAACMHKSVKEERRKSKEGVQKKKKKGHEVDGIIQAERTKKAHKKSCRTK